MKSSNPPPNILFIMADDHAAKSISCYGAGINSTPHLDRLAKEGMGFNHCYVTNSICTPSRAAILCGTHNHVNGVVTLDSKINKRLPNVAKQLRSAKLPAHEGQSKGGYQTAMIGKWHLGEGRDHEPTGFDYWSVVPGQGEYWDPQFLEPGGKTTRVPGYATDIITDKTLDFIRGRDKSRPFFAMCHHKAPHRSWEYDPKHKDLYKEPVRLPDTFTDDYKNRANAAKVAKMRVAEDLTYTDLGLVQPEGPAAEIGVKMIDRWNWVDRKVPAPVDPREMRPLICKETGQSFRFETPAELAEFKFQRYMQRYLRTIQSIDDNVGRLLDFLDEEGLADNTVVIYTSDQGFFLGEHGWFDKRFMYEESFQMPFLVRYPREIRAGSVCDDIISNVDFAPTFLDLAGYYEDLGLEGARPSPGGEEGRDKEWELFDCEKDPLELFNCYDDPKYAKVVELITRKLEEKMAEIGDEPVHDDRQLESCRKEC
ncbi:hypothetical protein PG996_004792 [Apiospora saccharicola]|uniref:Sulfatase N-terminal domain-containing protein n=1 Tax=Apiospora saccharicola TaxID=335842 RepID=A0ABR1W6E4_9PEZI